MEPFLGEIKVVGFNFAPRGYALCNGQLLSIAQNTALFSLLGTTFGGNGQSTFGLPNLQSRVAVGVGQTAGLSNYTWGQVGGSENVTLNISQMPSHNHVLGASDQLPTQVTPGGAFLPTLGGHSANFYTAAATSAPIAMNPQSISLNGGGQGHTNIQPFLGLYYIIAIQGVFPSRN